MAKRASKRPACHPRKASRSVAEPKRSPAPSRSVPKPAEERSSKELAPGFPVIGIGASAGGLAALPTFFANVPDRCGMAFVVVQHLDPNDGATIAVEPRLGAGNGSYRARLSPLADRDGLAILLREANQ